MYSTVVRYNSTWLQESISGKRVYNIVPSGKMLRLPKDGGETTELFVVFVVIHSNTAITDSVAEIVSPSTV